MSVADEHRRTSTSAPAAADRDALIDTLLMAGLDEYFAGRYERAIQVWSRVFFLDRTHARARAYIERARSALAEHQRLAEASAAPEAAVPAMTAMPGLFRLEPPAVADPAERGAVDLPVVGALAAAPAAVPEQPARPSADRRPPRRGVHTVLVAVAGVVLFLAGYTVAARDRLAEWWTGSPPAHTGAATVATPSLPAETALNRARQALAANRFEEARRALALVPVTDPLRKQADALLAELQQAVGARSAGATPGAARP
jgi:hypothetical protein